MPSAVHQLKIDMAATQQAPRRREAQKLDVGCGTRKQPGAIGLDRIALPGVDVVHDLDVRPYPFPADTFDEIYARHVIEHVASVPDFLSELHRIAAPGARLHIVTPHYSSLGSWSDPTHRWHFSTYSFDYFAADHPAAHYAGGGFRIHRVEVTFLRLWRLLGVACLVNAINRHPRWRIFRKVWEEYLSFVIRARDIQVTLEAVKAGRGLEDTL
ncbi:class I SAM-dependent methyltransferase [Chloracidobacterium validum]|uniref:Class I SAM-dependent methyltransferase n=1 Tax=Chloracidobacterium validum TaxID=2821543 RepID=A0ABX8BCC5_9BACT|nr:methyltransferase domain-containing protein [Chloracidobacterium validum]QUW04488.1 class I SAM-dependent methyltransferase [Chloracidobacterium validum]